MISNNELVHLLDEATHLANMAYVNHQFFGDANLVYERALKEAEKVGDSEALKSAKKLDKGRADYQFGPDLMGRWDENTGDYLESLYHKMDKEMKPIGERLLPFAVSLVEEAKKINRSIAWELAHEFGRASGVVGRAGEIDYEAALENKKGTSDLPPRYVPYTPFFHGIFGEHVKRLCLMVAQKRGMTLETVEELPFDEMIQEEIRLREASYQK